MKKIHWKIREKTQNMTLEEKFAYLVAYSERKDKEQKARRDERIKAFRSEPCVL